eukprot:scaffold16850_cov58-Phaeocystis_antarctica.AAC.5
MLVLIAHPKPPVLRMAPPSCARCTRSAIDACKLYSALTWRESGPRQSQSRHEGRRRRTLALLCRKTQVTTSNDTHCRRLLTTMLWMAPPSCARREHKA